MLPGQKLERSGALPILPTRNGTALILVPNVVLKLAHNGMG